MDFLISLFIKLLTSVLDFLLKRKGADIADSDKELRQRKLIVKDKVQHILAEAMDKGYRRMPDESRHVNKVWMELADIDEECGKNFREFWNSWNCAVAIITSNDLKEYTTQEERDEQFFHQMSQAAVKSYEVMRYMRRWQ